MFYTLSRSGTSPCPQSNVDELGINNWIICQCNASSFDCTYYDQETCLLLDAEFTIS